MLGFNFNIEYKEGLANKAADTLSCVDITVTLMALSIPSSMQLSEITQAVKVDVELGTICTSLRKGQPVTPGYTLLRGHLLYNDRLVLPKGSQWVQMALDEGHDSKVGGHGGFF